MPPEHARGLSGGKKLTVDNLTLLVGCCFVLLNAVVLYQMMPASDAHVHHAVTPSTALHGPNIGALGIEHDHRAFGEAISAPPARLPLDTSAPAVMGQWLTACSQRPRCACLQHGIVTESEALFAAFPTVAFFVILTGAAAPPLAARLAAANLTHVYVLRADLQALGPSPMMNDVLNPRGEKLRALQALRVSNEFFDLQLVHSSAPGWLLEPTPADARTVLSLAAWTLLLLPSGAALAAWDAALATTVRSPGAESNALPSENAFDSTFSVEAATYATGCSGDGGRHRAGDVGDEGIAGSGGCSAGRSLAPLHDSGAQVALLVELRALRRLNAHHFSCWHSPRCHQRMYVMDLPRELPLDLPYPTASAEGGSSAGTPPRTIWQPRVPALFRVDDGTSFGAHQFKTLEEGWRMRGKNLGFDTGGMNLDTAIGLQMVASSRARLAVEFLALPVGRDMMLWNIIVGRDGLYAIDQEEHAFEDGKIPWGDRVWPYCISVRDCYEKALGALCGRQRPTQPLDECFAALTRLEICPDPTKPFPCLHGCRASFLDCQRRKKPASVFVGRNLRPGAHHEPN
jgi:hypothetical protein